MAYTRIYYFLHRSPAVAGKLKTRWKLASADLLRYVGENVKLNVEIGQETSSQIE